MLSLMWYKGLFSWWWLEPFLNGFQLPFDWVVVEVFDFSSLWPWCERVDPEVTLDAGELESSPALGWEKDEGPFRPALMPPDEWPLVLLALDVGELEPLIFKAEELLSEILWLSFLSKGVTSLSLRQFPERLIRFTTWSCGDHLTSSSLIPTI